MVEAKDRTHGSLLDGIGWTAVTQVTTTVAMTAGGIVAARVIPVKDFGLMGVAMLALQTLEALTQSGFDQAAVQRKEISRSILNTVWTANVLRGVGIFVLLALSAPLVGLFFRQPQITTVIVAISSTAAIRGFAHTHTVRWMRTFHFSKLFWLQTGEAFVRAAVLIYCALWLRNIWALVIATVVGAAAHVLLSHFICREPLAFQWSTVEAKSLFTYGKWVTAVSIISLLMNQADNFFVARVLSLQALGYYQMAFAFAMLPISHITRVVGRVTLPAYARVLSNPTRLSEMYFNVSAAVMLLVLSLSVYLFFFAPYVIEYVVGPRWKPILHPLRILILAGVLRSWIAIGGGLFCGIGRPDLDFKMNLWRAITLVVLGWPAVYFYQLQGISWAVVTSMLTCLPVLFPGLRSAISERSHQASRAFTVNFVCSAVLGLALWLAAILLDITLTGLIVVGALVPLVWLLALLILQRFSKIKPLQSIYDLRQPLAVPAAGG
jgi:O-antigen/teichoic acid export membrane protein